MTNDSRKAVATELADLLGKTDGARILPLLRRLGLLAGRVPEDARAETSDSSPVHGPVGVWRPIVNDVQSTEYVRDELNIEGYVPGLWSTAARIPAKGHLRRIVWLGESVARGYFLDPEYAPAPVLADLVNATVGRQAFEAVDLARSGHSPLALLREMAASACLSPDAFVVFAGNNLIIDAASRVDGLLDHRTGLADFQNAACSVLADIAEEFVDGIATIARRCQAPAILVIPEFNLGDWESGVDRPPLADPETNHAWRTWHARALDAWARHDIDDAERAGIAMCVLDGGFSATGLRIRAQCRRCHGDAVDARRLFQEARDAELWKSLGHLVAGHRGESLLLRSSRVVQDALRRRSLARGLVLVDLPSRLADALDDRIPDRRVFLDHSHLNVEGIRIAVASIAEALLTALGEEHVTWSSLIDRCRPVEDAIVGRSHLEAAVYASCWGQRAELIRYHADRAACLAPELVTAAEQLAEFGTRGGVPLYSRAAHHIVTAQQVSTSRAVLLIGRMNALLADVLVDGFRAVDPTLAARVAAIREDQYAVGNRVVNLIDPLFSTFDLTHPEAGAVDRTAFYRAYGHESRFVFVNDRDDDLQLAITARVPTRRGAIVVALNGTNVSEPIVETKWTTVEFECDARLLRRGINQVVVHWPAATCEVDTTRQDGNRFFPRTGDIFSFTVHGRGATSPSESTRSALVASVAHAR
jgi:hypothetical protein